MVDIGLAPIPAREVRPAPNPPAALSIRLTYEDRFIRRKRLVIDQGEAILLDLPETRSLDHGDQLVLADGRAVQVIAAPEELLAVRGENLTRLAWHIGNRHTPCQIGAGRLLIKRDHVLADMLLRLGASLENVVEPFTPEGGAYGHGRTHGHAH